MHLSYINTNTISKQTERDSTWPTSPRSSIGCVQNDFRAYGTFGANRALILRQDYHYLQMDRNELPVEYHRVRAKQYLSVWYVWRKPCTYLALTLTPSPNGPNEIPHEPNHLGVQSGASKMIFEPMVRLAQTVHLCCADTNTVSKRTKLRFHRTHVT